MTLVDQVRQAGVVGAGGGGFPTQVKLAGKADTVIANGAECEPLLHKDAVIMEHQSTELVRGMGLAMDAIGAKIGVIAVKAKNRQALESVEAASAGTKVRVHRLGDYYPAGDEYDLVYGVTGRLIPPAGIPLQVGVVVCNVETIVNVGVLESFNVATLIQAADAAAKAAAVTLLEIRLAMALGGKAYCTLTGDVGSVQSAVAAGRQVISEAGVLVNAVVISRPHPDVYREII